MSTYPVLVLFKAVVVRKPCGKVVSFHWGRGTWTVHESLVAAERPQRLSRELVPFRVDRHGDSCIHGRPIRVLVCGFGPSIGRAAARRQRINQLRATGCTSVNERSFMPPPPCSTTPVTRWVGRPVFSLRRRRRHLAGAGSLDHDEAHAKDEQRTGDPADDDADDRADAEIGRGPRSRRRGVCKQRGSSEPYAASSDQQAAR